MKFSQNTSGTVFGDITIIIYNSIHA